MTDPVPLFVPSSMVEAIAADDAAQAAWSSASGPDREALVRYVVSAWTLWGGRRRLREVVQLLASGVSVADWAATAKAVYQAEWADGLIGPPPF